MFATSIMFIKIRLLHVKPTMLLFNLVCCISWKWIRSPPRPAKKSLSLHILLLYRVVRPLNLDDSFAKFRVAQVRGGVFRVFPPSKRDLRNSISRTCTSSHHITRTLSLWHWNQSDVFSQCIILQLLLLRRTHRRLASSEHRRRF